MKEQALKKVEENVEAMMKKFNEMEKKRLMSERRKSRKEEIKKEMADKLRENYKSVTAKIFEDPNYKRNSSADNKP